MALVEYFVRYHTREAPTHTQTDNLERLLTWHAAKQRRHEVFQFRTVKRVWVERVEYAMDGALRVELKKERWGHVLERGRLPGAA